MIDKLERYNTILKMRREKIKWKIIAKHVGLTINGAANQLRYKIAIPAYRTFPDKINILFNGKIKTLITRY